MWLHDFHGAADRVDPASSALPLRRPHLVAEVVASWEDGDHAAGQRMWADRVGARLAWTALEGGSVNLLGPEEHPQIADVYGPNTVRLLFVVSCLLPGPQFLAYIALWIVMPDERKAV